jgi:hypothetical protein
MAEWVAREKKFNIESNDLDWRHGLSDRALM